jgi:hypothetical protein
LASACRFHAEQIDPPFALVLAIVNPFYREPIAQGGGALLQTHTAAMPFLPPRRGAAITAAYTDSRLFRDPASGSFGD